MREKLNDNPVAQIAIVAVLLVVAAVFLLGKMGGGSEEEGSEEAAASPTPVAVASAGVEATGQPAELPAPGSGPGSPPPLPQDVDAAIAGNDTVVLLFVRDGGIDDRLVARTVAGLRAVQGVATFVVPASRLSHYVSITQGVKLSSLPALVVVRPGSLDNGQVSASVQYGFQSPESIVQAVVDARYHGGTLAYHP